MSCSTASIVPTRLISTATQPSSSSRHIRSTGPTSVGHSRFTRRRPGSSALGASASSELQVALDAVLLERRRLAHVVAHVGEHLEEADLEPVLAAAGALAHDEASPSSSITVGGVIQFSGLYPPASAWTSTEAVVLEHQEARRLRQEGGQPAGVGDLAAGDDQAHGATLLSVTDNFQVDPPSMRVHGIGYIERRTQDVDGMTRFFRDVLGLPSLRGGGDTVTFQRLPTHRRDLVEVYAPEHSDIRMIPDEADFVVAFVVDDIREALAEVQAAGLELVNEPVWAAEAFGDPASQLAWFWVRAPDGRIYVIEQVPD